MKKWEKAGNYSSVQEVVEQNTGLRADKFLHPVRDKYIKNLDEAAEMIKNFSGGPVIVIGDYDADGDFSTSIMLMALKAVGINADHRIPKRHAEGYGLGEAIVDEIKAGYDKPGLAITIDNGIAALGPIQALKDAGWQCIVIDHHLPVVENGEAVLPNADIVVDPNAVPGSGFNGYCAAGLAYRLAEKLVDDESILDILAVYAGIATVTDVMQLVGENRELVINSLDLLNAGIMSPGISALFGHMSSEHISEDDYGFQIGPMLNASGRLLDTGPDDCIRLLTAEKMTPELEQLSDVIYDRNKTRQKLSLESQERIYQVIRENHLEDVNPKIIPDNECDEGIIGISAGWISETYRTAAIVCTKTENGVYKGSGRTFGDLNLKECLDAASEHLLGYGGHPGAAGLSFKPEEIDGLWKGMHEYIVSHGFDEDPDRDVVYYDLETDAGHVEDQLEELDVFAPYGEGNPRPTFMIRGFKCDPEGSSWYRTLGQDGKHVKFSCDGIEAIGFNMADEYIAAGEPKEMDLLANLSWNYFRGDKKPQAEIIAFRPTENETSKPKTGLYQELEQSLVFI